MVLSRAAAGVGAGPYHITSYHLVGNLIILPSRTSYMSILRRVPPEGDGQATASGYHLTL